MNLFYKNFNLKGKILVIVLPLTVVVFMILILYFSINVKNNTTASSKEIVDNETKHYASLIQNVFKNAFSTADAFSDAFIENIKLKEETRDTLNKKILLNILKRNKDFLSVALHYELNALDNNYNRKNGRVRNVAFKLKNEFYFSQNIADTTDKELTGPYYNARRIQKNMMWNPYYDTHTPELAGILMVTVTTSLVRDGKYLGQTGIDLTLEKIQQMVQKINPFKSSVAYLVAPNNKIIAHTDTSVFYKNLLEVNTTYKKEFELALNKIKQNKAHQINIKRANKEMYVSFTPIVVGEDGRHWALVTETHVDVLTEKSDKLFLVTIIAGIIGLIVLTIVIYFLIDNITKRLLVAINFAQKVSDGDLSSRIDVTTKDEIGQLAKSMNNMAMKLKKMVVRINSSSEKMNMASTHISEFSSDLSNGASEQASSVEEVMASIEEMGANIHSNTENAKATEKISNQTLAGIKNGSKSTNKTLEAINEITEKITIINEISRQTNILSLNAAVEAARAGQYGKGFGVVANEVKKLAERSQEAANYINELSEKGVNISSLAEKELSNLVPEVEKTAQLISEISNASSEQSNGVDQIQEAVQALNNIAQKNASFSEKLDENAKNLEKEAKHLKTIIEFFKT